MCSAFMECCTKSLEKDIYMCNFSVILHFRSVPVEGHVPATSTTQLAVAHLKEETRPASHPSPHLPPRNPHNFHAPAHPTNQSSTSVQASSRASTPASVEKIHDDYVANRTTAPASSTTAAEGAMAAKESQLPDHSRMTCRGSVSVFLSLSSLCDFSAAKTGINFNVNHIN